MSALIAGLGLFTIMLGKDQFIEVKGSTIMFTLGSFFFLLTLMSYPIRKG
jgi:intracellular septation protein A